MAGDAKIIISIGATDSGKSFLIKKMLRETRPPRVLVWDINREYAKELGPGTLATESLAEVERWLLLAARPDCQAHRFSICYYPPEYHQKAMSAAFKLLCKRALQAGHLFFVLDEAHEVLVPGMGNEQMFKTMVTRGRHKYVQMAVITQRPALIDKTSMSNSTLVRCFKLTDPNDVKYMSGAMGLEVAQLDGLQQREYWERDTNTKKTFRGGSPP